MDSGLSTGGFTTACSKRDESVRRGRRVAKSREDPRPSAAVVMERTNLRYLQPLPDAVGVARARPELHQRLKVLPAVAATMRNDGKGKLVVLGKPQFEARRSQIGAKGVVRDPAVHEEVIKRVVDGAAESDSRRRAHRLPDQGARRARVLAYFTGTNGRCPRRR